MKVGRVQKGSAMDDGQVQGTIEWIEKSRLSDSSNQSTYKRNVGNMWWKSGWVGDIRGVVTSVVIAVISPGGTRNPLYRRVMARYVQLATKAGVTQAVFPEGGLSLDGAMGPAKLGLISYIVADFQPDVDPDVVFVPVALNYDRVLEDRVLTQAKKEGTRTFRGSAFSAVWFSIRYIWRRWRGKAVRFGHAGVGYGEPFSLKTFLETHNGDPTKAVGQAVRKRVMGVIPALPVPTLSYALQNFEGSPTRADLVELVEPMLACASHPSMPTAADVVDQGLASLISRRIVTETPAGFLINKDSELLLNYYARSVAHLFDKR